MSNENGATGRHTGPAGGPENADFGGGYADEGAEAGVAGPDPQTQAMRAAGGGAVVVAVLWVLWRLRIRRRPPTPSERLAKATQGVGTASVAWGGRAASRLAETATPVAERTGEVVHHGVRSGAEGAQKAAALAAPVVLAGAGVAAREATRVGALAAHEAAELASRAVGVGSKAAHAGQRVGTGLAELPDAVAEGGEKLHRTWTRWTGRLLVSLAAGVGYVLGARAGRERYTEITELADKVAHRPEVQQVREKMAPDQGSSSGL